MKAQCTDCQFEFDVNIALLAVPGARVDCPKCHGFVRYLLTNTDTGHVLTADIPPKCPISDCVYRACDRLQSPYCFPHTMQLRGGSHEPNAMSPFKMLRHYPIFVPELVNRIRERGFPRTMSN